MAQEERPDGASPGEPEYEFWKAAAEAEKNHYTKQEIADAAFDVAFTLDRKAK